MIKKRKIFLDIDRNDFFAIMENHLYHDDNVTMNNNPYSYSFEVDDEFDLDGTWEFYPSSPTAFEVILYLGECDYDDMFFKRQ